MRVCASLAEAVRWAGEQSEPGDVDPAVARLRELRLVPKLRRPGRTIRKVGEILESAKSLSFRSEIQRIRKFRSIIAISKHQQIPMDVLTSRFFSELILREDYLKLQTRHENTQTHYPSQENSDADIQHPQTAPGL